MRAAFTLLSFVTSALLVSAVPAPAGEVATVYITVCPGEPTSSVAVPVPPTTSTEYTWVPSPTSVPPPVPSSVPPPAPVSSGSGGSGSSPSSGSSDTWCPSDTPSPTSSGWGSAPTWPTSEPAWPTSGGGEPTWSSAAPSPTGVTPGQCTGQLQCCSYVGPPDSALSLLIPSLDVPGLVGINCVSVDVTLGGPGLTCAAGQTPTCCEGSYSDLIDINCLLLDINL